MTKKKYLLMSCLVMASLLTGCGKIKELLLENQSETGGTPSASVAEPHDGYINLPEGQEYAELYAELDDSTALARLYHSDAVSVLSIDGDWANVSYGTLTGYVPLQYISFSKPAEPMIQAELPPTEGIPAGSEKPTEAFLFEIQPVAVTETPTAQLIFLSDLDGFEYVSPISYASYVEEKEKRNAWCSAQSVYIYAQPDSTSAKREANMLYYGDTVTVLGDVDNFYYIATDSGNGYDLHGYVGKSYITYGESPYQGEPENATYGRVNVKSANVRSTPNKETDDNVLFTLYNGAEFEVISYDGYWYKIDYDGTICYISHKMVEVW